MTGAYQSVIGMEIIPALRRLRTGVKRDFEPASADPRLFALLVDVDPKSGRCLEISRVRWQPAPSETV
jgi:calcineurin-like phosphoesterase